MRLPCKRLLRCTVPLEARAYRRILGWDCQEPRFAWHASVGIKDVVPVVAGCFIVVVLASCPLEGVNGAESGKNVYGSKGDPHEGVEGEGSVGVKGVERRQEEEEDVVGC